MGLGWSVPVSSIEMTGREQTGGGGGETYHKWGGGGPKTVYGEGLYGMFPLPLSLPPPFVFL